MTKPKSKQPQHAISGAGFNRINSLPSFGQKNGQSWYIHRIGYMYELLELLDYHVPSPNIGPETCRRICLRFFKSIESGPRLPFLPWASLFTPRSEDAVQFRTTKEEGRLLSNFSFCPSVHSTLRRFSKRVGDGAVVASSQNAQKLNKWLTT